MAKVGNGDNRFCRGRCANKQKHHCINDANPNPDNCRLCQAEVREAAALVQLVSNTSKEQSEITHAT